MSAVSEEDVLALLVLWGARPAVTNCDSTEQMMEQAAWNAATARSGAGVDPVETTALSRLSAVPHIEAAITQSERLCEVERCQERVIDTSYGVLLGARGPRELALALRALDGAKKAAGLAEARTT